MKKILIVNKSFETGGIQSSMVNMANELSKYYQVDLFVYNSRGHMAERLDEKVNVINANKYLKALCMTSKEMFRSGSLAIIAFRCFAALWTKLFDNRFPINIAAKQQTKLRGYDLAIAYHQEQRRKTLTSGFSRIVDKCVDAGVKVAWLHFDSNNVNLDSDFNNPFYDKMDRIVCVSRSLMENFAKKNPALANKMDYCYNFMTYDQMLEKSKQNQEVPFPKDKFICFSACRIVNVKALDRAVNTLAPVFKAHHDLVWYIAGDGSDKKNVEAAIKQNGLEDRIVLIGNQSNPYPYMKNADLIMNVSYNEAAPMVYFEAKALGVPMFATKTASAEELLNNGFDSFICENTEEGMFEAFSELAEHKEKIAAAKENLKKHTASNIESLEKIGALLKINDGKSKEESK